MKKTLLLLLTCTLGALITQAQISGTVYRDFNGNGTRQNASPNFEPGVAEIIIKAYDSSGVLISSDTSDKDGLYSMPYTVPVRVEFSIPTTGNCVINTKENTGFSGDGNNVRFVNAATTTLNYGILFPDDYTPNVNPMVYVPVYYAGDPLAGGTSSTQIGFRGFEYNSNGTILSPKTITQASMGTVWGVAYSKQAKKIFTSAFIKRQVGLGPMGSGGIYMLEPTASSFNVTQFYDLDANGYRTRAASTAVAYGQGSSYTVDANGFAITYNGPIDAESGFPEGLGVVGSNTTRGLPAAMNADCYDPAAFDQVGKVGLGDLDISDDGKFLFVMNLYSRKVYRLELNDAYNPTSVISVTSYSLPAIAVTNGEIRPFAVQYYRDKIYVGAVASGENGGSNTVDGATDLYAHVLEMTNPLGSATFNTTPILSYPLNYQKGYTITTLNNPVYNKWFPWTNNSNAGIVDVYQETLYPSPVFSNIEFTDKGDMVMNFFDRSGHQQGYYNYKNLSTTTATTLHDVGGDILMAGKDCATGNFVLENNGSYNSNGTTYTGNATNNEGPGSGEFYYQEYAPDQYHHETSQGASAMVRGSKAGIFTLMDPIAAFQGGVGRLYTDNGSSSNRTVLYNGTDGEFSKANGLGDIEMASEEPTIEVGNLVWNDANGDGIQTAGETGIGGVVLNLYADFNNDSIPDGTSLGTVTTSSVAATLGTYYFNESNIADGDPVLAGAQVGPQPNKNYIIQIGAASWIGGLGVGSLSKLQLTQTDNDPSTNGNVRDNDAYKSSGLPQINVATNKLGDNNFNYDFGFTNGTIGNFVWTDLNQDGIFNEAPTMGINGIKVKLYDATSNTLLDSTVTANNGTNPGYYEFTIFNNGDYFVQFPTKNNFDTLTLQTTTAGMDSVSDANIADGKSPVFTMNIYSSGVAKNNPTIDAGFQCNEPINDSIIYTQATCPTTGIIAQNTAKVKLVTNATKAAISITGVPTTTYAAATAVTGGTVTFTAQNGVADTFYIRTWNSSYCYSDTILTVEPSRCCPTFANITTPANNTQYCSGAMIPAFNVSTNAIAPDSVRLVYFDEQQTDPTVIYTSGNFVGQKVIVGTANAVTNDANFTNIQLPSLFGTDNDTIWFYAIYIDRTGDTICKEFTEKPIIIKPQPVASISGYSTVCNGSTVTLTSEVATTYKWGKMPLATTLATTQVYSPTPTSNATSIYWLVVTNSGTCASDTVYHSVLASNGISGTVFRDFNSDGVINTNETVGFKDVKVRLFDHAGALMDSILTDVYGRYVFPNATAGMGQLRIEFDKSTYPSYTQESFSGLNNGTDVQFITAPSCSVNLGLKETRDFCGTTPKIVSPIFIDGATSSSVNTAGLNDALYSLKYADYSAKTTEATRTETGATWGIGYAKGTKQLYSAAFLKRHVGLLNGSLGQIYVTDKSVAGSPTTPWLDVSTLGLAGNWQYFTDAQRGLGNAGTPSKDSLTFSQVAATGIGDIDVSEDETQLYVMDLINKQLLIIDIATKTLVGAYPVPSVCNGMATPSYYSAYPKTFTSTDGKLWKNGHYFNTDNNGASYAQTITNANNATAGTNDATLYNPSIYSGNGAGNFLNYQFPLGNGDYSVKLHLTTNSVVNNSNFNVTAEGSTVFSNVNIYVEAGNVINKGVTKTFTTTVTDGALDIKLAGNAGTNVLISGFEITPTSNQSSGQTRPFAINAYKGKVYVGAVCDASGSQDMSDLTGGIFEFNPQTHIFNSTPILSIPLDYTKGASVINPTISPLRWFPWTSVYPNNTSGGISIAGGFDVYNQPVLSDIEFDLDGSMIIGFFDRMGHQMGANTNNYKPNGQLSGYGVVGGDLLRAYYNGSTYELESNAKEGVSSTKSATAGANNNQGPNGGEFYYGDYLGGTTGGGTGTGHYETLMGGLAFLPGSGEVRATVGDPLVFSSGGFGSFNNTTGNKQNGFTLYTVATGGVQYKSNGLGDMEILCDVAPLQIGNYVWLDANNDGIQDPNENPIPNIAVTLWKGNTQIASTTTNAKGEYYFSENSVAGVTWTGTGADTSLIPQTAYSIKIQKNTQPFIDTLNLTLVNSTMQYANDQNDNDAAMVGNFATINLITGDAGSINHSYDFGFSVAPPLGSIGNYVWTDDNANGLNDEPATSGINGVKVYLYDNVNPTTPIDSVLTANNGGNPGYYLFDSLNSGTYFVKFPTTTGTDKLTNQIATVQTDGNSDANITTGNSPLIIIDAMGSGNDKDNMTIDAGYYELASLGNYVWNDLNHDGDQNTNEVGVAGISVTLYDDLGNPISTILTDAYGYYLFDNLIPAYYTVGFTLPQNYVFTTTSGTSETDAINSDVDVLTGNTTSIILSSGEHQMNIDAGIYFQPQNTATVGNYVWFDTNADGIQDANEVGISGVTVTLYNNANEPIATTITDANGQYLFTNVTPGTYSVGFTSPVGMILSPNNGGVSTTDNSDANLSTGMTGTFVVNAGDNITYVDAGFTPQPSTTASLGDKVWYDVNQNGVQDAGELGVEGVTVTLFQSNGTSIIAATVTDAYGNYSFNNLAAGQYVVGFTNLPIDYVLTSTTGTNATTNSDANTTTAKTSIIDLSAGEHDMTWDAGIFNNVPTNNNSIGDYVWNDVDKDGIQDATEHGVAGITVTLYDNTNTPIASTSTNANGQYTFPDLPNGTYTVGFSNLPEGFVFSPIGNGTTSTDSDPNPSTGLTSSVSLTGNTHITTLDAGINLGNPNVGTASLGDLVWYDINNNGLQDAGEAGVQDVTATLYASNGTIVLATTTTNALGYYVFTGLPAGDYIVGFTNLPVGFTITSKDANAQGIEGETNSDVNTATNKTDVISLALGQDKMSVDMGIVPPAGTAALGDLVWFDLNNDGIQTNGEPGVQGVTVTLYDNTNTAVANTTTDINGEYHFVGLTPATYSVGFSNLPTGYTFTTASGVINDATNSDANVTTGMTATVTLASGDNNLNLDAGIKSTTVASVGDYVWYDINHDGIQDANEQGLGGILVTLYDNTNTPVASTITNPDGSYIFTNVTPGTYTMGFENLPTGMTFTTQETNPTSNTGSNVNPSTGLTPSFTVTAGTHNPTIDAGLTPIELAGLGNYVWYDNNRDGIQGSTETGVTGTIATLYASNGTTVLAQAITDGNGAYSFTNLDAGDYMVGFSNLPLGYVATQSNGTLNDATNSDMNPTTGKTTAATLLAGDYNPNLDAGIMKPIAQLGNYVWNDINKDGIQDNTEVGVAGITVTLFNNANAVVSTTITDAYGYYKFSPLEEGTYHIGFTLPANYVFTLQDATTDAVDADVNPTTGITGDYVIVAGDSNMTVDAGIYFEQPATASVGNYVWLDVNQDGIQDGTEHGISGVTVTLCSPSGTVIATTITDVNGYYLFSNVTPGNYGVGFTSPVGLVASPSNGIISDVNNSDANPLTGKTNVFTLSSGENITYVDAGFYSQSALLGGLGDKVWYDVNQDGVQNNGEIGVQGVTVTLYQADGTTMISTTTTDAYGNYIFNSLSQGQYVVGFSNLPIDYVLTTTTGTDSTSNSDANVGTGKTSIINLAQGQYNLTYDAGIYTTNSSNTNSIGDFVWFDLNKDGIQTSNESGAPGVTVTLYDNTNTIISVTSTNSDGAYLFPDLPNGTYYVGFSNLPVGYGFSQTGQGTTSTDSDPNTNTGLTSTVTLTGNTHITDLDAGIGKGNDPRIGKATLGDLVWYDLNNNGLQDNGESGVAGVLVTLYQGDGTTTIKTTTTDALGNYIFTNLDAGSFVVGFTNLPVGYTISPKNADAIGIEGELNSDVDNTTQKTDIISLATGEDKLSVDMGIAPPVGTASLGNLVWFDLNFDGLQSNGEPGVQGVSVTLYDNANAAVATTTTNALGEYYFIGLTPGTYSVGFDNIPSGYILTTQNADAAGINGALNSDANATTGLTSTVTLVSGDNNLNLDAGINSTTVASVGDYVWLDINQNGIQDPSENGVGGVLVTLYNNLGTSIASTITSPNGSYIFTNVVPGDYTIGFANLPLGTVFTIQETNPTSNTGSNVNPTTGITPTFNVFAGTHNPTIDAGLTSDILSSLGNYVWHDFNEDGLQNVSEPGVPGVLVTLYAADGTTVLANASTNGNGGYLFTNLLAGNYVVGFSNLPIGSTRTKNVGASVNEPANSDMNVNGKTSVVTLGAGEFNPYVDAGIYFGVPLGARKLIATTAIIEDVKTCKVNWYTVEETNTKDFIIERSIDGIHFNATGNTNASYQTIGNTNYTFNDDISAVVNATTIHYRIVLRDLDNKTMTSNIISVKQNATTYDLMVYPAPFTDKIMMDYIATEATSIEAELTDAFGNAIMKVTKDINKGLNTIVFPDLSHVASGSYFIKFVDINQNIKMVRKVVK